MNTGELITLVAGTNVREVITDNNYLYAISDASPGILSRVIKRTLRNDAWKSYGSTSSLNGICQDDTHVFVGSYTSPGKIERSTKSNFAAAGTFTMDTGENNIRKLACDDTHIYAGLDVDPGKIVKILSSDFSTTSTLDLATGESFVNGLAVDDTHIYAGCYTSPAKIVRIDKSDFSTTSTLELDSGSNGVRSVDASHPKYIYVGSDTTPGIVSRINKDDFSTITTLTVGTGKGAVRLSVDSDLYLSYDKSPAFLDQYSRDFKTLTSPVAFTENAAQQPCLDSAYIYVPFYTSPGYIRKILRPHIPGIIF